MTTEMTVTLTVLAAGGALIGGSSWMTHRPKTDTPHVRWAPWKFLILLGAAVVMLSGIHALTLSGVETGKRGSLARSP
jgi:hypothetical protein